jgi:hypothetical protein
MIGERRRDVLPGPYVTEARITREHIHTPDLKGANVVDELCRIVRHIEGESEMSAARLQELEELAAKLSAAASKLPAGPDRNNVLRKIGSLKARIYDRLAGGQRRRGNDRART